MNHEPCQERPSGGRGTGKGEGGRYTAKSPAKSVHQCCLFHAQSISMCRGSQHMSNNNAQQAKPAGGSPASKPALALSISTIEPRPCPCPSCSPSRSPSGALSRVVSEGYSTSPSSLPTCRPTSFLACPRGRPTPPALPAPFTTRPPGEGEQSCRAGRSEGRWRAWLSPLPAYS